MSYNLLSASAIHIVNVNRSIWSRLELLISGPIVVCSARVLHSGGGCTLSHCVHAVCHPASPETAKIPYKTDFLCGQNSPRVKIPWKIYPQSNVFLGKLSEVEAMTTSMRSQCQITFCNTLLKYKTKPQNLGKMRCQALPNEFSIINSTKKCLKRIPTLSST